MKTRPFYTQKYKCTAHDIDSKTVQTNFRYQF